jgi:hypothetical protein
MREKIPHQKRICFKNLTFFSDFESGNLLAVSRQGNANFDLEVGNDSHSGYRSWFYFGVTGAQPGQALTFRLVKMSNLSRLFAEGLVPVTRTTGPWARVSQGVFGLDLTEDGMSFQFRHTFGEGTTYFAMFYPWTL